MTYPVCALSRSASKVAAMAAPSTESAVRKALYDVRTRIAKTVESHKIAREPRLVAISKTKPIEAIREAYEAGHRHFGENYVQEISEKAPELPDDICWHFVGHLQSNKIKLLLDSVPNLSMLETVDSVKLANKLNNAVDSLKRSPLPVMVQVNTSGEESKSGVSPDDAVELARHVHNGCQNLRLAGLMTIGMPDYTSRPENFQCLKECRKRICKELGLQEDELELSMGMSGDFENAIAMGSTNVRVGSTIFGARDYSKK
uniref:Pyridoxal phosphate homeostasis protein n=1 Tax=Tetraselmis sp. GSL018 TaxID=582737 RepID=A0A061R944_9CHLO|mmetsp:Transcript_29262/g.69809  ORF Transcript_29262/g.69809 Transcript_29262/m.69809 type:complete len:259 (-) Transcript_29262:127-903(-)|eukprot:CAMPEP_0177592486 /NCGR_PEP_ID=MMETSP0419_2-20121207/8588_1 /TAXON_ID=582737 /ORGANISM="Tetraselmis sp., Strain GSL018" /LENGTH=258 /DNA_ID=CAMNT_0019083361 /DNA_START=32 /DNA_END=808 /DNA_ORIENTATION=+